MRHCPKCRSFYDDGQLRFCLQDGVPLVNVNQSDDLWNEGKAFVRETQQRVLRETRVRWLKKVISMLVTTVLVIMVVSVITLNSWIYLSEPEKELVQNVLPSPTMTPERSMVPTPEMAPEMSPEATASPEPTPTDSSKPTPTPAPTPTRTRTQTPTPTPTPRPSITVAPPLCNSANETSIIKRNYGSYFFEQIRAMQPSLTKQYMSRELQAVLVSVTLNEFGVIVHPDCRSASISHPYQAILINRNGRRSQIPLTRSFSCTKSSSWSCR